MYNFQPFKAMFEVGLYEILLGATAILLGAYYFFKDSKQPPGPYGVPFLGYLPFLGHHPARKYFELSKKYGSVISLKLGTKTTIVLNDYDSIREAFVKQGNIFSNRPQNETIRKLTKGFGIAFRTFDDDYKVQRKFSMATLRGFGVGKRSMEDKILEETEYLFDEIRSRNGGAFDSHNILASAASNIICNVVLGARFSYDDEDFKYMVKAVNRQFSDKVDAFCIGLLMVAPILRFIPPFSRSYRRMFEEMDYVMGILQRIFEEHKRTLDPENPRDFIDEYLKEMKHNKHDRPSFCEPQLFQIVRDLFVAGTETTASTIRWALLLFAHRPDLQTTLHNEIQKAIGDGVPSMKHEKDMPYTCAFIHELMRHRTVAPLSLPHMTSSKTSFRGYDIPQNSMVLPNIWAVHHNSEYFDNPLDFCPDRFIGDDGTFIKDQRVIPFSVGPRNCLGEQLARMEIFLFMTNIVQRFELRTDPSCPLPSFDEGVFGLFEVPKPFKISFVTR